MSTRFVAREGGISSFCPQCQTDVITLNNKCCTCYHEIRKSGQLEGVNNDIQSNKAQEGCVVISKKNDKFSDEPRNFEIKDNRNYSSPSSSATAVQKKRHRKRKKGFKHYGNGHRNKKKKRIKKINKHNKKHPVIIADSDNEDSDCIIIVPDFPSPTPSISSASPSIASVNNSPSPSPSLSVLSNGMRQMTLNYNPNNMVKWRQLGIKENTIRGLESMPNISIPEEEGIALINAIRRHMGHVLGSILHHENRLLYLIVGLLEIMETNPLVLNNNNQPQKPQIMVVSSRRQSSDCCVKLFKAIAKFYKEIICERVIGGMRSRELIQRLRRGYTIECGTPGKHCEMIRKEVMTKETMNNVIAFVMDDADELTSSQSMREQMDLITTVLPDRKIRVLWLQSICDDDAAPNAHRYVGDNICNDNDNFAVLPQSIASYRDCIDHHIIANVASDPQKKRLYKEILALFAGEKYYVIFFNRKDKLRETFGEYFSRKRLPWQKKLFCLDGDEKRNSEREHILENFQQDGGILFCSDLLAKGISLPLNVVINFDTPHTLDRYISRFGCAKNKAQPIAVFSLVVISKDGPLTLDQMVINEARDELSLRIQDYPEYSSGRKQDSTLRADRIF